MKKVFTLGLCAVAALSAFAYRNYDIPAGIDLKSPQPSTTITEQDGVYTLKFTGEFANIIKPGVYTEYEVNTTGTDMVLLNGCVYNLEFDYQCDETIDDAGVLYWTNTDWGKYKSVFPATSGDEWGHGAFYLGDRILHGFGTALNQKLRLHFRPRNRENADLVETYGKPLTVKVKNLRFVPVQKKSPTSADILYVDINEEDVNKPDNNNLAYTKWEKNSEGELTLRWQGDFDKNIEYTCRTSPLEHPMLENVDYNFVFEYKGPALDCVQVLYWAKVLVDGLQIGNNTTQPDIAPIPESTEWTTITIPITERAKAQDWGRFVESVLRIGFNDHSYVDTNPKGANYGKPLEVQVRNLRFEPTNAPATEPKPIDLYFTSIGRHQGEPLQADESYDITFCGQFPQPDKKVKDPVEYEAFTSYLEEDLPDNELYYLTFSYQAEDIINELVARYWDDTKQPAPIIGDSPSRTLPATKQWTQVYLPLSNRGDYAWGKKGQNMRIHFYNHDRMNPGEDIVESTPASRANGKYGKPINVKVKDLKLVPGTQLVESSNMTPTGIENVVVDNAAEEEVIFNGEPEYYNIQGQRIMNPEKGFYIVRRGNKVSKVILR